MLYTIAVILLILWLLAILGGYVMGGLINILLGRAVIMVFIDVFSRRRRSVSKAINRSTKTGDSI
jgi:hypothetical protein